MTKGFSSIILLLLIPLILGLLFFILTKTSLSPLSKQGSLEEILNKTKDAVNINSRVFWEYNVKTKTWSAIGTPPDCQKPFVFPSPVNLSLASAILYPGQLRGGDYKPHGGVRFDNLENNSVDVYAPMTGNLIEGSRHWASGEVQYALYFLDDCGIIYKLDHLRELIPKFEEIINKIPMGEENDSRTTQIRPADLVQKGELIATKVGLELTKNVFLDFGVYDLKRTNGVDYSSHDYYNIEQYGAHALCWLDLLEESDKALAKSLPGADGKSGKQSDYCK